MDEKKRIELKVPAVPHSLRGFIENTVRDDRAFRCMIESPVTALIEAGVPIREDSLTEKDCTRLVKVLANIRSYVIEKDFPENLRFEDIFDVYEEKRWSFSDVQSESNHGTDTEWDCSDPSMMSETRSTQEMGEEFAGPGPEWILKDERIISAPLLSPSDLTEILVRMDEMVKTRRELHSH